MQANLSYSQLKRLIQQANPHPPGRHVYGDEDIALALFWAKLHGHPTCWASGGKAYPPAAKFEPPSASTVSRRLRTVSVIELIARVAEVLGDRIQTTPLKFMDSRPLTVGYASHDRHATVGYCGGGKYRGYKLCAISGNRAVRDWLLGTMKDNDQKLGVVLLKQLPADEYGYVGADNGFDGNPLYVAASAQNHILVSPPREQNRNVRDSRRNSAQRIRSLDLSDSPLTHAGVTQTLGSSLLHARGQIERTFSHGVFLGLSQSLPPWTRRPRRVALHVQAMLVFQLWRLIELQQTPKQTPIDSSQAPADPPSACTALTLWRARPTSN